MKVDLFILNYNGAGYIANTVTSFLEAAKHSVYNCHLIVIDNSSIDDSLEIIRSRFPEIQILKMENRVLRSFNEAVKRSSADVVFLLNNDLIATPDCLDPTIEMFTNDQKLFMVSVKSYLPDGSYEGGLAKAFISYGMFETTCHFNGFEKLINDSGITFAAGFGAFNREKFVQLNGYDDLYLPGRLEDSDLLFRAWKMGWKSYYQPKSIMHHIGAKSFHERFGRRGTMELAHRNTFLFMWKNLRSPSYLLAHFFFLIPRMMWMLAKGRFEFITAFFKAIARLPAALKKRKLEKSARYQYSDKEVLSLFQHGN